MGGEELLIGCVVSVMADVGGDLRLAKKGGVHKMGLSLCIGGFCV